MKKIFVLFVFLSVLTSCQSLQKRGEKFAEQYVKQYLYVPESYENISTQIDTAYHNPCFDQNILSIAEKIVKAEETVSVKQIQMKSAKSSMSIWGGSYMSSFSRNEYNEAKENYEKALAELNEAKNTIETKTEELRAAIESIPSGELLGWLIDTRYRAENNAGDKLINEVMIVVSKDFNEVLFAVDPNDKTFEEKVKKILDVMGVEY